MSIEYEAKILHINTAQFAQRVESLGARKTGSYHFRRYVFDTIPAQANKWVRLRTDGSHTTITCKEIVNNAIDGTIEKEVVVDDFDQALDVLVALGLKPRGCQENRREEYILDGVQITVDSWPLLDDYAEIEGDGSDQVMDMIMKLGYSPNDAVYKNTDELYKEIGADLRTVAELRFDDDVRK